MAVRTGHIYSRSRDRVMSRGPRAVPPAWREQQRDRITSESRVFRSYETRVSSDALPAGMKYVMEDSAGGTIFVENLPPGTTSKDLLEFFSAKIGPVDEYFMIYNDKAISKNMAIVQFRDITFAYKARNQLHGVAVDKTWPLRVRVVLDAEGPLSALIPTTATTTPPVVSTAHPQLMPAPGNPLASSPASSSKMNENRRSFSVPTGPRKKSGPKVPTPIPLVDRIAPLPLAARVNGYAPPTGPARDRNSPAVQVNNWSTSSETKPIGRASVRAALKKGPKRTAKRAARLEQAPNKWVSPKRTREELDAEMDVWRLERAAADAVEETIAKVTAAAA